MHAIKSYDMLERVYSSNRNLRNECPLQLGSGEKLKAYTASADSGHGGNWGNRSAHLKIRDFLPLVVALV